MGPLRLVMSVRFVQSCYSKPGRGSYVLELQCGHELSRKVSDGLPNRARCRQCRMEEK